MMEAAAAIGQRGCARRCYSRAGRTSRSRTVRGRRPHGADAASAGWLGMPVAEVMVTGIDPARGWENGGSEKMRERKAEQVYMGLVALSAIT